MAKRRKKRRLKKPFRFILSLLAVFAFFALLMMIFQLGLRMLAPDPQALPQTSQSLTPVALGIDVSEWQENIDWEKVRDDGYQFAIIRTSYGIEQQEDAHWQEHIAGAQAAGLAVGAYHYSHAITVEQAIQEADFFISLLEAYQWDFPVYYDIETDRQDFLSAEQLTAIAQAFLERLQQAGYEAGLYASQYWLEHRLNMTELQEYEVWIASYTDPLKYEGVYGMWQYTKSGHVQGVLGNVDINICYQDYPSIIRRSRHNNY